MGSTYCVFLPSILSYNAQLALVQSHRLQAGVLQTYVHRHCGLVLRKNRMLTERSQGSGCSGKQVSWGGGCCPYILAMDNLAIKALPHIVNALAVFSAGNSYPYCASHTLCGFALSGIAPPFLRYGVSQMQGIPIYCVLVSLSCRFLSLLQSGDHSQVVLSWIVNLVASCQLLNYVIMCTTCVASYYACKSKNMNRSDLPFTGWFQRYRRRHLYLPWSLSARTL